MKNTLKIDFSNSRIVMDRTFAKKCENTSSAEYMQLQRVRADYPTFEVIRRQIKKKDDKECYKGLTYAYMENYIASHDDEEGTIRKAYDEKKQIAECHTVRYPAIKRWFLHQYPEIAKFGMKEVLDQEEENEQTSNITKLPVQNVPEAIQDEKLRA